MKLTIPIKSLNVMGLFQACADFHVRECGDEGHLFAYFGTEKQRIERYDRDISEFYTEERPFERDVHLLCLKDSLIEEGETIILPFAGINTGEPVECADGKVYELEEHDRVGYSGEFQSAVLILKYRPDLGTVTISSGIEQESTTMTGVWFEEQSIDSLDKPAEAFVMQFTDLPMLRPVSIIEISEKVEKIYSPFSGIVIDSEEGAYESDPTLLFTNFDNSGGYVSQQLIDHLGDIDEDSIITEEIASRITIPGAVVFRHDCGWNGVMLYGFAP
jgi:hypothetical protein